MAAARIYSLVAALLLTFGSGAARAETLVCFAPLGVHDARLLDSAAAGAEMLYGVKVRILAARALPEAAFYEPRQRYRAEKLLNYLDENVVPKSGCDVVVGFTARDISTTKGEHVDWGILGLAWLGGPSAVVSTYRMRRRASRRRQAMRAVKVANHELGHVFGAEHHPDSGCLMEDGAGTVKTVDRASGLLCPTSRRIVEETLGREVPTLSRFDWARVLSSSR